MQPLTVILVLLLFLPSVSAGQNLCVNGKVTDQYSGMLIRDLTVLERNSGIGTITAFDGSFSLILKPGIVNLQFFSEKYDVYTVTFTLKRDTTFHVEMDPFKGERLKKGKKEITLAETASDTIMREEQKQK